MIDREALAKQHDLASRTDHLTLQRSVFQSELCSDHKLLMLALISHMRPGWPVAFPGLTLARTTSMSRTKYGPLLEDLLSHDWIVKLPSAGFFERPGRRPNVYSAPRVATDPSVPTHCTTRKAVPANLARRDR